jgi:diguanylate cyclase (GGDEF)-like protein
MNTAVVLEAVRRLGLAATRSPDAVRDELDRAIRSIAPAIDAVLFFDERDDELVCVSASGARVAAFRNACIARSDAGTLFAQALASGHRAVLGTRGARDARSLHPADAFAVAIPLRDDAGRTSIVYAAAPRAVSPATVEAIVALADHAGFAYTLAREREAHARRAEHDALTGLLSPRALREQLAMLIERARFAPLARLALLFIDTDHFKEWNDRYGHASGDALLRALAGVLRSAAQHGELAARNGGDEFCLVFVETEKSRAVARAQALRAAIAALDTTQLRPVERAAPVGITASIGVAAYPADVSTPNGLLERADEAMYHSKRSGRNAVSYAGLDGVLVCCAAGGAALV